ncbi:phage late control D family protein [Actinoplanes awajinensis]|uniref:Phage tail protein n=1 Tax=Actinoplanes awajinensis subsp. mycoplanecinus TaxID=135947 RepID=A0A101JFK0_9ACTN|nr:contractile injection system protein, VgrG/Pvc8 family [Actinoplanes awajinensis]KUL25596.1 hypothetical protein ADL15_40335 [Actinoplanes awajinensis subsp. mycoplanecinus]
MLADNQYYRVGVRGGAGVADLSALVTAVEVEEDEARPSRCALRLSDPFVALAAALPEGVAVEVELGTAVAHMAVFRGRVHRVEEMFAPGRIAELTLYADDARMRLGLRPRSRLWSDVTLTELVARIARDHGLGVLAADVTADVRFGGPGIRQQDETDLAFVLRIAAEHACLLTLLLGPQDERLGLVAEARLGLDPPVTTLVLAGDGGLLVTGFQARCDIAQVRLPVEQGAMDGEQARFVQVREPAPAAVAAPARVDTGWVTLLRHSPEQATLVEQMLPEAPGAAGQLLADLGVDDVAAAEPFAPADALTSRVRNRSARFCGGMRASGSTVGEPRLRPLTTVNVEGAGARFSGIWLVSRVRHVMDSAGYRTEFVLRR